MNNNNAADIIVIGAGNAALCAALAAREAGKSVIALEKAPEPMRGGNTYFTGGAIRFSYRGIEDVVQLVPDLSEAELAVMEVGSYTEAKYFEDLMRVTEGLSDQEMADALVRQSFPTMRWMYEQGVRFVPRGRTRRSRSTASSASGVGSACRPSAAARASPISSSRSPSSEAWTSGTTTWP